MILFSLKLTNYNSYKAQNIQIKLTTKKYNIMND
jgi:hypothetical protein